MALGFRSSLVLSCVAVLASLAIASSAAALTYQFTATSPIIGVPPAGTITLQDPEPVGPGIFPVVLLSFSISDGTTTWTEGDTEEAAPRGVYDATGLTAISFQYRNADGRAINILGSGYQTSGGGRGNYVLTLVAPEPAGIMGFAVGAFALAVGLRRRV